MASEETSTRFLAILMAIATSFAFGAFVSSTILSKQIDQVSSVNNYYVAPNDLSKTITKVQDSTVMIECDEKDGTIGSGWAISLENKSSQSLTGFGTSIITAHHVVQDCMEAGVVNVYKYGENAKYRGIIESWDSKQDLALIATSAELEPLKLSPYPPTEGHWIMTVGSPDGYEASITTGEVMNYADNDILFTAHISGGNSGGPLINNSGEVVGTVLASAADADYNFAINLDGLCAKFIKCEGKFFWKWN